MALQINILICTPIIPERIRIRPKKLMNKALISGILICVVLYIGITFNSSARTPQDQEYWQQFGTVDQIKSTKDMDEATKEFWRNIYAGSEVPYVYFVVQYNGSTPNNETILTKIESKLRTENYLINSRHITNRAKIFLSFNGRTQITVSLEDKTQVLYVTVEGFRGSQKKQQPWVPIH